ncbi:MAG: hypothetical protein IKW83_08780 [Muribaculaceae bacterium]|nr:hypothetical protein [Muribaculaceae bacterium]
MQEKDQQNPLFASFSFKYRRKICVVWQIPVNGTGIDKRSSRALSKIDSCFALIEENCNNDNREPHKLSQLPILHL